MRFKRVPFPRYLNRPRLWLIFEEDELKFIFIIDAIATLLLFLLGVPPFLYLVVLAFSSYISLKVYRELRKKISHNAIDFFFYELGLYQPKKKHSKDVEIPYGFIKKLID